MKKTLLIGGGGYVGTVLTEYLLKNDHEVTIMDLFIYNNNISIKSPRLKFVKGDIRNLEFIKINIKGFDNVIHLACISNDPSFDLNPELSRSINYTCFEPIVKLSKDSGIKKFIFASSSSVYGIKSFPNVTEDSSLEPITDYSKYKVMCEEILLKNNTKEFSCTIIRPATVCGFSRRQRFDLVVNILTNLAYNKKEISVFGGNQLRPNINIHDMCRSYIHILNCKTSLVNGEIFNVGYENQTVENLAKTVAECFPFKIKINKVSSEDNRSYHISSEKIKKKLNFDIQFNIKDAVKEIVNNFNKNSFKDSLNNEMYFNIKRMKSIKLK